MSPSPLGEGSGEGPRKFLLLLALKLVSFGAFWVVFLQLSCMLVCRLCWHHASLCHRSWDNLRHKKRLNSLSCAFIFTSRRIPAYTSFIYDNWGEYTPTEITGGVGRIPAYTPNYSPNFSIKCINFVLLHGAAVNTTRPGPPKICCTDVTASCKKTMMQLISLLLFSSIWFCSQIKT